jgi:hypothetical protein
MSSGLKGNILSVHPGGDKASLTENAKELLQICIKSIHDLSGRHYFYRISGDESVPGTLSYLLSIREADLKAIFKICGFYNEKRDTFQWTAFETWAGVTFERGTVEVTTFCFTGSNRKESLIKIGLEGHPSWPADQVKEMLDPSRF